MSDAVSPLATPFPALPAIAGGAPAGVVHGHGKGRTVRVAAVPGMVGATLQHLKALRRMQGDGGWIRILTDEAERTRACTC